uniref:Putative LAGLIDADG homing endonuclease n=1 Tax=Gloeotilopsis planctonica TaxID=34157 RepID=A0A1B2RZ94_9CHLO|nr:putative LAGLIDADG homing endonuclease [Gloeotilopsis planctonica]
MVLTIGSKKRRKRVLHLTNGKFVGPFKINQLQKHGYEKILNIKILPATQLISFANAWLAGFFEADGSINITIRNRSKTSLKKRTDVSISFAQKDPFLLSIIAALF